MHDVIGEVRKFRDLIELSSAVAENIAELIKEVVASKGVFHLALSGGNTPTTLFRILATTYRNSIPWKSVHVFFCDERFVPHMDPLSNFRMAKENLFDLLSIPRENIHPIPTDYLEFEISAGSYETELRKFFSDDGNTFDLAVMGIGKEGHTASLFPNSLALDEEERWVLAVHVNAVPPRRVTLTFPVLNRAGAVYFLVSGTDKAEIMGRILDNWFDYHACPAVGIIPKNGRPVWWIDLSASPDGR